MSDQYLGQIEIYGFGYAPKNWVACAGQLLPIQQNAALFSLLGTTFGGDGVRTFQLPDLRGRLAMGQGNGVGLTPRVLGEVAGQTSNTLTLSQTPTHAHPLNVISNPTITSNTQTPAGNVLLAQTLAKVGNTTPTMNLYATDGRPAQTMAAQSVGNTGGQPHSNMQPYLAVNYCIALVGIFPSRN